MKLKNIGSLFILAAGGLAIYGELSGEGAYLSKDAINGLVALGSIVGATLIGYATWRDWKSPEI